MNRLFFHSVSSSRCIDTDSVRPDVVLGTDIKHTPAKIIDLIENVCVRSGFTFGCNHPFAGTCVPMPFYGDSRVTAFMLEINRKIYMDEATSSKHAGFDKTRMLVGEIISAL